MRGKSERMIGKLVTEKKTTFRSTTPTTLGLIFSCDRAMQLDGTLRSFFLHCKDPASIRLNVLYLATNDFHAQQYVQLEQAYAPTGQVRFFPQRKFREDAIGLLAFGTDSHEMGLKRYLALKLAKRLNFFVRTYPTSATLRGVLFLVDDNLFVNDFSLSEASMALALHPEAIGFSLRLGRNTTYSYSLDRSQMLPEFTSVGRHILEFNWTTGECDFGYPLEISSSIYRLRDVLPLLSRISFENPNTLEGMMAARAYFFRSKFPHLLCYEHSTTFCSPINKVQTVCANRSGVKSEYTSEHLAQLFAAGHRINVEAYTGFVSTACHQEVELVFRTYV